MPDLRETWVYDQADPGIMLFTAALKAWQLPIQPGQAVLELGCNESDFLTRLHRTDPSLQLAGLDWRQSDKDTTGWRFVQESAWDQALMPRQIFDWVLLLGALEHFGLGWYQDPKQHDGDALTLQAVEAWLKPGGSVYFDVPCNPADDIGAHFRTYSPLGLSRLIQTSGLREVARGYSGAGAEGGRLDPTAGDTPRPVPLRRRVGDVGGLMPVKACPWCLLSYSPYKTHKDSPTRCFHCWRPFDPRASVPVGSPTWLWSWGGPLRASELRTTPTQRSPRLD